MLLTADPVWTAPAPMALDGSKDSALVTPHTDAMNLPTGSVAVSFRLEDLDHRQTLVAKDHRGFADGDFNLSVANGRVEVSLQTDNGTVWLRGGDGAITPGVTHDVVVSWGAEGFRLFVNGRIARADVDFRGGMAGNPWDLVVGANNSFQTGITPNLDSVLDGVIWSVSLYDRQLTFTEVADLAGRPLPEYSEPQVVDGVLTGTDGPDQLEGRALFGGYGNDFLTADPAGATLDGGYGEDVLLGSDGDDLLVSRSDGGEPIIAQAFDAAFDPLGEVDPLSGRLTPGPLIAADDLLVGGAGADTFRFDLLMNAKERVLFRKTQSDGSIDWGGVAGVNGSVHDHWVERIGDDVIADFSRAEGDRIMIMGHTADPFSITHHDTNGDGVLDASIIELRANQGPAGAHTKDHLGTITVYGDLVRPSDLIVHSHAHMGVIDVIGDLEGALGPRLGDAADSVGASRWVVPVARADEHAEDPILRTDQPVPFDRASGDYVQVPSSESMSLESGSVAVTFVVNDLNHRQTLVARDHDGPGLGEFNLSVVNGRVEANLQDGTRLVRLRGQSQPITPGVEHSAAVTWGPEGFRLYVDGVPTAANVDYQGGWDGADWALVLGGSNNFQRDEEVALISHLDGSIEAFALFDRRLGFDEIARLAGLSTERPTEPAVIDGVLQGADASESLVGSNVHGGYGDDTLTGTDGPDRLDGGYGEDALFGGPGDDVLISRSDGGEPRIAQAIAPGFNPGEELNPLTGRVTPGDPIAADDVLVGGPGADTFRFETLMNAKERVLFQKTQSDGSISWAAVAQEDGSAHAHWVERIGDDVIADFNRAEGDRIMLTGHTAQVYTIEHVDSNGDGRLDASVLRIWANQGVAGAHTQDVLGSITVYGDLVTRSDIHTHSHSHAGVIDRIDQLEDALGPRFGAAEQSEGTPRWAMSVPLDQPTDGAVLASDEVIPMSRAAETALRIPNEAAPTTEQGSIAVGFRVDDLEHRQTLVAIDQQGREETTDLWVSVIKGRVEAWLESESGRTLLYSPWGSITPGTDHHVAVTWGSEGFHLYLDGELVGHDASDTRGLRGNASPMLIGAAPERADGPRDATHSHLKGSLTAVRVFQEQIDQAVAADLAAQAKRTTGGGRGFRTATR